MLQFMAVKSWMAYDMNIISGPRSIGKCTCLFCIGSALGSVVRAVCDFRTKSKEKGEKCYRLGICTTTTALLWKPAFMAMLVELLAFLQSEATYSAVSTWIGDCDARLCRQPDKCYRLLKTQYCMLLL